MSISPLNKASSSDFVGYQHHKVLQAEILLEKEEYHPLDFADSGLTIQAFKKSAEYKKFVERYKHLISYIQSKIQHQLPNCNRAEKSVFCGMLDNFLAKAFDDSKSGFKVFSEGDLEQHIYTSVHKNLHEFTAQLDEAGDSLSPEDIMRAVILLLPEKEYGSAWINYCTQLALHTLIVSQNNARDLPNLPVKAEPKTPIFIATMHDKFDVVRELLRSRNTTLRNDETDESGKNLLLMLASKGHSGLTEQLMARKSPVFRPTDTDNKGNNALHDAISSGSISTVRAVMPYMGDNLLKANDAGETPLHFSVRSNNNKMLAILLSVADPLDVNQQDDAGNTAAHLAIQLGNPAAVRMLVVSGASTKPVNHAGHSMMSLILNLRGSTPQG
ncbi:ankyrin repeat domain-containing protein [Parashewanella spongiae]|uniref:Ankyrin repeat domain-containing protein n=1 Tax=Parashewanella spongiae TaxID=342950 RepID=A0A3A6TGE5_9GAMM|nr:ankyrin repeat domain-containing protein [Parashewanella spongiae]MCL1079395.1 ankyrin repeat domain-containing protein [Parashewanella spongiae]RJY07693.1 ankyrin repeat domain-containing protein [Parashewanella spongiae]